MRSKTNKSFRMLLVFINMCIIDLSYHRWRFKVGHMWGLFGKQPTHILRASPPIQLPTPPLPPANPFNLLPEYFYYLHTSYVLTGKSLHKLYLSQLFQWDLITGTRRKMWRVWKECLSVEGIFSVQECLCMSYWV